MLGDPRELQVPEEGCRWGCCVPSTARLGYPPELWAQLSPCLLPPLCEWGDLRPRGAAGLSAGHGSWPPTNSGPSSYPDPQAYPSGQA